MMRWIADDRRLLAIAIGTSIAFHAALLAIRFVSPESARIKPFDAGLAVILVNAKQDAAPLQADALAQANLNGGGNAEAGRARSPLPNNAWIADGNAIEMQRQRIAELESKQQKLLAHLNARNADTVTAGERSDQPQIDGRNVRSVEQIQMMARRQAEIALEIREYSKRPLKAQLTPSTREVSYALYYTALQKKIEQTGTLNFPQQDGKKIYGELIVYIPVYQDGRLYEKEGGPRVERGSGNPALDAAALAIVRRSAPYGAFPAALTKDGREHVWEIITRFTFTRDQQLETQALGRSE
jgi:protein TonB